METEINEIYNRLSSNNTYLDYIPVLNADTLSYEEFFEEYLLKNQACLIKNISHNWNATKHWIDGNELNYDYLCEKYGSMTVTVYNCNEKHYNSQKTCEYKFADYLTYWKNYISSKHSSELPILYLKDWHLKNLAPDDDFYEIPIYFKSDFINEYLVENDMDDYRFVYMGPKGSWTPFHADVFNSYSWSTNIYGKKRWILYPPGQENHLKDSLGNLPYDVEAVKNKAIFFEITQEAGDAIFVPTQWHHQVWNLADTISINHNWINGCNLKPMWLYIEKYLELVKKEIDHLKDELNDFPEQCQLLLNAAYGLNFASFYKFISYILEKRLKTLESKENFLGKEHVIFDILSISDVLKLCIINEDFNYLSEKLSLNPNNLLSRIKQYGLN